MAERRSGRDRRPFDRRRAAPPVVAGDVVINGWTVLCHQLFLDQMERLTEAVEAEQTREPNAPRSGNAKLLGHLLDLAFDKIPAEPDSRAFRHGGTLGEDSRHWFRGKTGNGRYRLFYRFHSAAKIIVLTWVNDEESLRTYGSDRDAYAVFAALLRAGNPPDDWDELVRAASGAKNVARTAALHGRRPGKSS